MYTTPNAGAAWPTLPPATRLHKNTRLRNPGVIFQPKQSAMSVRMTNFAPIYPCDPASGTAAPNRAATASGTLRQLKPNRLRQIYPLRTGLHQQPETQRQPKTDGRGIPQREKHDGSRTSARYDIFRNGTARQGSTSRTSGLQTLNKCPHSGITHHIRFSPPSS